MNYERLMGVCLGGFFFLLILSASLNSFSIERFMGKYGVAYRKFTCRMGWHEVTVGNIGFDGCSATSLCRYCNKKVLQDSQGNWF